MRRRGALALAPLLLVACAATTDPAGDAVVLQTRLNETRSALVAAIGPASCRDVSQCVAVPIGQKACGGPAGHLASSGVNTDVAQVDALAAEHRDIARRLNALTGAVSDCALVLPAPLACVATRCEFERP